MSILSSSFFRICHWGPLIALGIIFSVSLCTVSCLGQWHNKREVFLDMAASAASSSRYSNQNKDDKVDADGNKIAADFNMAAMLKEKMAESGSVWREEPTFWSKASPYFLSMFLALSGMTLYYYLNALWGGPGKVPPGWKPDHGEDRACLQFCATCSNYKPPRAHHCRQCGVCVPKMDHHCPWINTCVGHQNQAQFAGFLAAAVAGCSLASAVLGPSVYWGLYRRWYLYYGSGDVPIIILSLWGLLINLFVLGLAIGVVIAVGILLFFQGRAILRNRTGIEDWILEKANYRRSEEQLEPFLFPYDLGRWRNLTEVIHNVQCKAKGDGIHWPVRDGCHQYTLTLEQIYQKASKRARSMRCVVRTRYSGSWSPVSHGLMVFIHPPCSDEPRIRLQEGDIIMVTRWKKYWLYGDCVQQHGRPANQLQQDYGTKETPTTKTTSTSSVGGKPDRHRGWFPRRCIVPLMEETAMEKNSEIPLGLERLNMKEYCGDDVPLGMRGSSKEDCGGVPLRVQRVTMKNVDRKVNLNSDDVPLRVDVVNLEDDNVSSEGDDNVSSEGDDNVPFRVETLEKVNLKDVDGEIVKNGNFEEFFDEKSPNDVGGKMIGEIPGEDSELRQRNRGNDRLL